MKSSDFHVSLCKSQLGCSGTAEDAGVLTEDVIIRVVTLDWAAVAAPARRTSSACDLPRETGGGWILKGSYQKPPVFLALWLILLLPDCCSLRNQTLQDESPLPFLFFPFVLKTKTNVPFSPLSFGVFLLNAGNIVKEWTMGQLYLVIWPVPFVMWSASCRRSLLKMDRTVRN